MRMIFTPSLLLLAACVLCSCGNGEKAAGKADGAMLEYSAPENNVSVEVLQNRPFFVQIISNGKAVAMDKAALCFETGGVIREISVFDGKRVAAGSIVAKVDDETASLALQNAKTGFEKARLDLFDVLAGQGYMTRDTLAVPKDVLAVAKIRSGYHSAENALAKARKDLAGTEIRAPFSGRVSDVKKKKWDMSSSSEVFCTLLGDSRMDVTFSVMESDYSLLSVGLPVIVVPFGSSTRKYNGSIVSINPSVDSKGQVQICARITNDGFLIDGMNVKVTVNKAVGDRLVVPKSAVVIRDNLNVLFRCRDAKAEWVYVNLLEANGASYAVEPNTERGAILAAGDTIIVSGNLNLADGSSVVVNRE